MTSYNHIAGQSLERLAALSDGIFAVAMTILVLDIHAPLPAAIHNEAELWAALSELGPRIIMYLMGFLTLGIFWVGQQTQLNHFTRTSRSITWIHIAFLALVSLMPFSTSLLAQFITLRVALLIYWANIFLLGATLYVSMRCANKEGLIKHDLSHEMICAMERRIIIAQSLYACGALLAFVGTYWSIGFIFAVQLNYALAPKIRWLERV